MKAFLILEDGTVFTGTSIGSTRDCISEIVFNTSMTGYLEVLTDPSYAGQAVVMTYPLIGNYGITPDMESKKAWPDGYIVRELSRMPSNFRCEGTIQDFLEKQDIPGIAGIDTRALTKILREKGTMNGMITTNENYDLEEILPKLSAYTTGKVVEKVQRMLTPLARAVDVAVEARLDKDCTVAATEDDIYQIAFNLMENAVKYNLPGGKVMVTLCHTPGGEHGRVLLRVEDTGVGIPEEDLSKIFDRFYRVDKARSRAAGGTGLGLSIVRDTARMHGGTVDAHRRDPEGTCFEVSFPLADGEEGEAQ